MAIESPQIAPKERPEKFDRFHPEMPNIPGVGMAASRARDRGATGAGLPKKLGVAAGLAVLLIVLAVWMTRHHADSLGGAASSAVIPEASAPAPVPPAAIPLPSIATFDGRVQAATNEELPAAWASKKFVFVKPFSRDQIDAMVIRLPNGDYWAFALQEPNGRCELEYVTDLALIGTEYQYRANHPMVVNPCNKAVYDPLKIGSLGGSIFVRGDIVKGGGLRPPISIDVEKSGNAIIADRIE